MEAIGNDKEYKALGKLQLVFNLISTVHSPGRLNSFSKTSIVLQHECLKGTATKSQKDFI